MPHSRAFRLLAAAIGLLTSLATPALALGHGLAHEHLAGHHGAAAGSASTHETEIEHADEADHDHDGISVVVSDSEGVVEPAPHQHSHAHASVATAVTVRDTVWGADETFAAIVHQQLDALNSHPGRIDPAAALHTALLPRPGPTEGAPGSPRAPPTR